MTPNELFQYILLGGLALAIVFTAMLIPLTFLLGVLGGVRRSKATRSTTVQRGDR